MKKIIASYRPGFTKRFWFKLTIVYTVVSLLGISSMMFIFDTITNYRNFNELMQPINILGEATERLRPIQRLIDRGALNTKDITNNPEIIDDLMKRENLERDSSVENRIQASSDLTEDHVVFDENDRPIVQDLDTTDERIIKLLMTHRTAVSGGEAFTPDNLPHSVFINIPLSSQQPAAKGRIAILITAKFSIAKQLRKHNDWISAVMPFAILTLSIVMSGYLASRNFIKRLRHMTSVSSSWSEGNLDRRIIDRDADELSEHSHHLNVMAQQLKELLGIKQEAAVQVERTRMARELHDTVKQNLFALSLQLAAIKTKAPDLGEAKQNLLESRGILKQAQEQLVGVISELQITGPIHADAVINLKTLCENLGRKFNVGMHCTIQPDLMLPDSQLFVVSRVIQESIANAKRHGNGKKINISLVKSKTSFKLLIQDDGIGFNQNLPTTGTGILSMRERVSSLPVATFSIDTAMGRGTIIAVIWEEQLNEI